MKHLKTFENLDYNKKSKFSVGQYIEISHNTPILNYVLKYDYGVITRYDPYLTHSSNEQKDGYIMKSLLTGKFRSVGNEAIANVYDKDEIMRLVEETKRQLEAEKFNL